MTPADSPAADYEALKALTYEYTFRLDAGEFSGVADLLEAGHLRMVAKGMSEEPIRGHDAIEAFYASQVVTYDGDPRTRHVISNHAIEIGEGGERAEGRCYFTVLQAVPKEPIRTVVCGQYRDSFERTAEGWSFTEKVIQVDYLTAIGEHFQIDEEHSAER
jgi:hypothetical protein